MSAGSYRSEWVDPHTGAIEAAVDLDHGGRAVLALSNYAEDIALRIVARP